jgi:hypothetical protein
MMKKLYYIDYPQENFNGQMHRYQCAYCQVETTIINGELAGHLPTCAYRIQYEKAGYDVAGASTNTALKDADDYD